MAEEGIEIAAQRPRILSSEAVKASDLVITMGCDDACLYYPGKRLRRLEPRGSCTPKHQPRASHPQRIKRRVERLISGLQPIAAAQASAVPLSGHVDKVRRGNDDPPTLNAPIDGRCLQIGGCADPQPIDL
jgi:hypothetical protein